MISVEDARKNTRKALEYNLDKGMQYVSDRINIASINGDTSCTVDFFISAKAFIRPIQDKGFKVELVSNKKLLIDWS